MPAGATRHRIATATNVTGWRDVTHEDESTGFPRYNTVFVYPQYDETCGIVGVEPAHDLNCQYELNSQKKSGNTITTICEDPGWYVLKQEVTYSGDGSAFDLRYELRNTSDEGYWFRLFRYHAVTDPYSDDRAVAKRTGYYRSEADEVGLKLTLGGEEFNSVFARSPLRAAIRRRTTRS